MTKEQIQAVFERVQTWPAEKQEMAARLLLYIESDEEIDEDFLEVEDAEMTEALDAADRGEFLTDEEVTAFFARFR
jgi:predicted transcriptional regulator